ncbi:hypothetical protein MKEN_00694900 [Mycena kentingensis (nom. inval.)]|nr:hypothetical protein MKEN_00694900 [Mycena kentingensis (nom. inval.)]
MSRPRPPSLRMDYPGINPAFLIGKVLTSARRSDKHPACTLSFSDGTFVQIKVDGYNPAHPGVPKELEMSPALNELVDSGDVVDLTVTDCALITLSDKAFAGIDNCWDQRHLGLAFKFATASDDAASPWHCVWAVLEEHSTAGACVFRTYDDVYLEELQRSPRKPRHRKKSGG